MAFPRTKLGSTSVLAGAATFGALAALITLAAPPTIQPPFPILFYLKFDVAEVIDMSAFLIFGPLAGLLTAILHVSILTIAPGSGGPFGPSLKFFGVISSYVGLWLTRKLGRHSLFKTSVFMVSLSIATRVTLMTLINYLYLLFIAHFLFGQDYVSYGGYVLGLAGINVTGGTLFLYILGLTAIYNAVHVIFSVSVSIFLVRILLQRSPNLLQSRAWITNLIGSLRQ
jgi:riboflavin transporter FmnP